MTPATSNERSVFESFLPEIEGRLDRGIACGPEEKEEFIAIAVGHAFLLFLSATRRGKRVTASTLAYYAKRMTWSGRQVGSAMSKYDAFSTTNGAIQHPLSLSENDLGGLLEDRRNSWTPADQTAFRIDWTDFSTTRAWTLSGGDGSKQVDVEYRDVAGNSEQYADSISLDTTAPGVALTAVAQGTVVELEWSASDAGAGLDGCELVCQEGEGSWQALSTSCSGTDTFTPTLPRVLPSHFLGVRLFPLTGQFFL